MLPTLIASAGEQSKPSCTSVMTLQATHSASKHDLHTTGIADLTRKQRQTLPLTCQPHLMVSGSAAS